MKQSDYTTKPDFTSRALAFFDATRTVVGGFVALIEGVFTDTVSRAAPMLAPLPPAFAVYTAMATKTPPWVAISTALAIELIGMYTSKISVRSWNWNKQRLQSEPVAPFRLAVGMSATYFVVVLALALGVEIWPDSLIIIYPGFVIIAAATYVANALATDMAVWELDRRERIAEQKDRQREAHNRKMESQNAALLLAQQNILQAQNAPQIVDMQRVAAAKTPSLDAARTAKTTKIAARREDVLRLVGDGRNTSEIAATLGVSSDTVRRDVKQLNGSAK